MHAVLGRLQRLALLDGEALVVLERPHVPVELREMIGELCFARGQVLARGGDDRGAQPEARRDLQRQAPAGRAVDQLVGRRERVSVEAEGRARDPVGRGRVGLERVVVARRDNRRAAAAEVVDDRHAERAPLDGVGARSDFVEQHERRNGEPAVHRDDVRDVRGEGAEARFDRLLVADIREQRSEDRHA